MNRVSKQIGESLVDKRLLSRDVLEALYVQEKDTDVPLARILLQNGHVSPGDLLATVADRIGMRYVDVQNEVLQPEAVSRLDPDTAHRFNAIPIKVEDGRVIVAVANPFVRDIQTSLETVCGSAVTMALASQTGIDEMLNSFFMGLDEEPRRIRTEIAEQVHLNDFLELLIEKQGSDLHLTAGSPPMVRVHGSLEPMEGFDILMPAELRRILYDILTAEQRTRFEETRELDTSHPLPGRGRFRVNVFFQRDSVAAVLRSIPNEIKNPDELGMPAAVNSLAHLHRGLVLVTGPTGSGKSTSLASIINLINTERASHIITVEDPIEFLHRHKKSIVNQREVGTDTLGFNQALKHILRQDPDVILVGEMRDLETIGAALTAAETGHLVFGTLHTQSAPQSIERIIDVFPAHQQSQVRVMLAGSLQAVLSQQLLPTVDGKGRIAAVEVMIATSAIRNLVRDGKVHQIPSAIQAGGKYGMQTMDMALAAMTKQGKITRELALERCNDKEAMQRLLQGG
ncbi:MAG: PilT/PilU family type 4a pilus ATPase [Acidimicrobiia bacterium]|nr:PilT/PilU family type 4a pilus ATPase [Acidimicrobiia bacterium]